MGGNVPIFIEQWRSIALPNRGKKLIQDSVPINRKDFTGKTLYSYRFAFKEFSYGTAHESLNSFWIFKSAFLEDSIK